MVKIDINNLNFTIYNDKRINKEISKQLTIIIDKLLKYRKRLNIISIILCGGFGRGEGSVIIENGKIKALNDYDIFLVVDNSTLRYYWSNIFINKISQSEIPKSLNMPHIDILLLKYSKIYNLPLRILYYDLKYGASVLWGKNVIEEIPEYRPEDIPLWEGAVLLFTRMMSLIYGYPLTKKGDRFIIEQCVKGILGSCEALLILSKNYHYSFAERNRRFREVYLERFPELYNAIPNLFDYYNKATRFKLSPDYSLFQNQNLKEFWMDVVDIFLKVFKYYFKTCYNTNSNDIERIMQAFLKGEKQTITDAFSQWLTYSGQMYLNTRTLFRYHLRHQPMHYIYASEPFVLSALYNNNYNNLKIAKIYLKKVIDIQDKADLLEVRKKLLLCWGRGHLNVS
jgi:hypothetical protein